MRVAVLCASSLLLSGCAFISRDVRLIQPVAAPVSPLAAPVCVEIGPIADARGDPRLVGVVRNGFYMPTADARTPDDVPTWIENYLRASIPAAPGCTNPAVLTGTVDAAFVDSYLNMSGRIAVTLTLRSADLVLLQGQFIGSYDQLAIIDASSEYEETLKFTLADLGKTVVPSVLKAAEGAAAAPL